MQKMSDKNAKEQMALNKQIQQLQLQVQKKNSLIHSLKDTLTKSEEDSKAKAATIQKLQSDLASMTNKSQVLILFIFVYFFLFIY